MKINMSCITVLNRHKIAMSWEIQVSAMSTWDITVSERWSKPYHLL